MVLFLACIGTAEAIIGYDEMLGCDVDGKIGVVMRAGVGFETPGGRCANWTWGCHTRSF